MRILIVDDESFARKFLRHQLAQLGCDDVLAFERAAEALEEVRRAPDAVQLIFLDLQMPERDGVEFVRLLAGIGYAGGLVLLSGEDERIIESVRRLAEAHQLDVRAALHKPVSPSRLRTALEGPARPVSQGGAPTIPFDEARLREGIAAGELVNVYQPKVTLATGEVMGVETLVRWRHPQGLIPPDRFIPLAEEAGLIDDVTRQVLTAALAQVRAWLGEGLLLKVAVNVSMDNLRSLDFPDFVMQAIAAAGVPARLVSLEVTESRLMDDPLAALDILTRLRLRHIGLSIDDFGTGHSSQKQLRDVPFDELKLDRGFVTGAWRSPALRAIIEANVSLAHHLGIATVAEGVEDLQDWRLVRDLGCDHAQGYFIAPPMEGSAMARWVPEWDERRRTLFGRL